MIPIVKHNVQGRLRQGYIHLYFVLQLERYLKTCRFLYPSLYVVLLFRNSVSCTKGCG